MLPWVAFVLIEIPPRDIKSLAGYFVVLVVVFCFVLFTLYDLVNIFSIICNRIGKVLWKRK